MGVWWSVCNPSTWSIFTAIELVEQIFIDLQLDVLVSQECALIWECVCDDMYLIIAGTLTRVALSMCLLERAERTISSGSTTGFSSTSRRRLETLITMVTSDEKRWVCTVFTPWRHTIFIMKWLLMFIPVLFYFIHNFFIFITQGSFN